MNKLSFNWEQLSYLGNNRFVKQMFIWVVLIPILANMLHNIPDNFTVPLFKTEFPINLELPFNWKLLYFSGAFFLVANLLYLYYAPLLFKENIHFSDFKKNERTVFDLDKYAKSEKIKFDLSKYKENEETESDIFKDKEIINKPRAILDHLQNKLYGKESINKYQEASLDDFERIKKSSIDLKPTQRAFISALYVIGFFFLGWTFISNFWSVLK